MIIVTGACGFIGFYLVRRLQEAGLSVLAVDKSHDAEADYLVRSGLPFLAVDITKSSDFDRLPTGVTAVVNLACAQPANMADDASAPSRYIGVNTLGVANILEYCAKAGVGRLIHTISHRNVQGLWESGVLIDEESPRAIKYTGRFSLFSISESAAADLIEFYRWQHDLDGVVLRLPSVYGFGHHERVLKNGAAVRTGLGVFIERAAQGLPLEVWGDPHTGRDVVYVKDVVEAVLRVLQHGPPIAGMFNIASGKALTLQEQVESVARVFWPQGSAPKIIHRPERPNAIDPCIYDISKAKRVLGWEPRFSFEDMLVDYKAEMQRGELNFLLDRKVRMAADFPAAG